MPLHEISKPVSGHVIIDGTPPNAVEVQLRYSRNDPHAVWMIFPAQEWCFDRGLLLEALAGVPSGEGDAHIHCDDTNVCVHLGSPADRAHVVLPREEVDAFAEASTNLIPRGAESTHLDLDGLISRILASTDVS